MLKRIAALAAVILLAGVSIVGWLLWGGRYVIELDQSELQAAFDKGFPVEKTYLLVIKVHLSDPAVTLREHSDRIRLAARVRVGLLDTSANLRGTAEVSCKIRYDAARGAFFADDPTVERLAIDGHPESQLDRTKSAITWILKGVFDRTPVYTLAISDVRQSFAKLILKDAQVRNTKLRLTLGIGE